MIMKKLFGFLIIVLLFAPSANANHHASKGKQDHKKFEMILFKKIHASFIHQDTLQLSEEKIQQVHDLKFSTKKQLITEQAKIDVIKLDIKSKLYDKTINVEAVNSLIDQKYELKKAKAKLLVAAFATLKNILGEEKWKEMKRLNRKNKKAGYSRCSKFKNPSLKKGE